MKPGGQVDFFSQLPALDAFEAAVDDRHYHPVPDGWVVIVSDIIGSTQAVAEGRYKEVNLVGAATIIAANNALGHERTVPAVFGGDGASMVVDSGDLPRLRPALLGAKAMAASSFDLHLRVGAVPVRAIREAGADVRLGRLTVRGRYSQAAFAGGGLRLADAWLKQPESPYLWQEPGRLEDADFSGLECRWQPLETSGGGYLCLLASAKGEEKEASRSYYETVLKLLVRVLGPDPNPMRVSQMQLVSTVDEMMPETKVVQTGRSKMWQRLRARAALTETRIGGQLMKRGIRLPHVDLPGYQASLPSHTDFRKFDDALRMVVVARPAEVETIREGLETLRQQGRGVFGIHTSKQALLTCMVFDRDERHLHFIDGADGGYVLAAKELKRQMAEDL